MNLSYKETWKFNHGKVTAEICHWGHKVGGIINDGKGIWNYYVYVYEKFTPKFSELWLDETVVPSEGGGWIRYDYLTAPFAGPHFEWHGGVTSYQKFGHTPGYRGVQIGCDFNHFWDHERGLNYDFNDVSFLASRTAKLISEYYENQDRR